MSDNAGLHDENMIGALGIHAAQAKSLPFRDGKGGFCCMGWMDFTPFGGAAAPPIGKNRAGSVRTGARYPSYLNETRIFAR